HASSYGTNGTGTPASVHDDRYGNADPSIRDPTLAHTTDVGENAPIAPRRGSRTASASAASAPFEEPSRTGRPLSPTTWASAGRNVSSATSQMPGGWPAPPNQRRPIAAAP